jgi:sulfite exporter TauE/SafE
VIELTLAVLAASLLGSVHCAGMCGGFVCFVAGSDARRFMPQAAYHAGRLVTYVALGALAGALGLGLDRAGTAAGIGRAAAILAGLAMIAWGAVTLAPLLGVRVPAPRGGRAHAPIAAVLRRLAGRPAAERALALGLLTTLLPCGWLWAFVATAAASGSPGRGAAVMGAFWLGTVPALAGVAVLARGALGPLGRRLPALTAAALVVIGLLTLTGRIRVAAAPGTAPATAAGSSDGCH